jgi:hypothetical protein
MEKIQKLSRTLKTTFKFLSFGVPILICLQWLLIDWQPLKVLVQEGIILKPIITPDGAVNLGNIELSLTTKILALLGNLLTAFPYIFGYLLLHKLFGNYQKGKIFISDNTTIYKKLGKLSFIYGILCIPLSETVMVLVATSVNPPGHRCLQIGFGTPSLEAILCGSLVIVIAWVMQQGQALQEENQLTI